MFTGQACGVPFEMADVRTADQVLASSSSEEVTSANLALYMTPAWCATDDDEEPFVWVSVLWLSIKRRKRIKDVRFGFDTPFVVC